MRRFFERFLPAGRTPPADRSARHPETPSDRDIHCGFKTRRGEGPFLLSCDGRVIPLRKAGFLKRRH